MSQTIIHVPRRFVSHEWGGTETVITEISRQQQSHGLTPKIVTSMALAKNKTEIVAGIPVQRHRYCYPFFGLSDEERAALDKKGGNLLSISLFAALLREPNVRLFHAHSLKRLGGSVATAARLRKKPFVVSLHGGVFDVPTNELGNMTKPIKGKFEWGRPFGALFGSRRILDDADMVICVGQSELEAAQNRLQHDRIAYLPNGVDTEKFRHGNSARFRSKLGIASDAFVVLNISRIDEQKNQMALIEAFKALVNKDSNAILIIIGPETQPAYAQRLREKVRELGLESNVKLLPGMRNEDPDLVDAYHASDVFALPSLHEPFGIVVLEAWSASKPVITSRVGGLKTLVADGETGLFFNDTIDLGTKLLRLRDDVALRASLARSGLEQARQFYDWPRINQQLEAIYHRAEERCNHRYHRSNTLTAPCPA